MPKKNSLKIAPYMIKRETTSVFDESLRPDMNIPRYWETTEWKVFQSTRQEQVIFDGFSLMEYTSGRPGEDTHVSRSELIDWRPNDPFQATLTIRELERGRSAARFWFEDEATKTYYPFFGQTLVEMLEASDMIKGRVTGTWIVVKKGSNYGIELYVP